MTNNKDLKLDYFSIENFGWVNIRPHLVSFGLKKLPKEINFKKGFENRK